MKDRVGGRRQENNERQIMRKTAGKQLKTEWEEDSRKTRKERVGGRQQENAER